MKSLTSTLLTLTAAASLSADFPALQEGHAE